VADGLQQEVSLSTSSKNNWPTDDNGWIVKPDGKHYKPTPGQNGFHEDPAAIRLLIGGRGAGKTTAGVQEASKKIEQGQPGLILAPDNGHFKKSTWVQLNEWIPIDPELTGLPQSPLVEYWSKGDKVIRFTTGATVWYGGIKDPDGWRGPNVNWIWYDEPGRHPMKTSFLIPIGSLRVGQDVRMWLTTTPRGVMHWLYPIFVKKDIGDDVLKALEAAGFPPDPNLLFSWVRTSTYDNRENLNPLYFAMLLASYHGRWREQELEGRFVSFEGLVYDVFDPEVHIVDRSQVRMEPWWPRWRVIDFGYKNPFVCQWWTRDPEGRYIMYREIYMTERTVATHAQQINALSHGENIIQTICDHDAEDRATLEENGIDTTPAVKAISTGVQSVSRMLSHNDDKRPDLYFVRDALIEKDPMLVAKEEPISTIEEFSRYSWPQDSTGRPRKEVPLDLYNHGMDSVRYMVQTLEGGFMDGIEIGKNFLLNYRG
jgi:PBSX family phage terminase large subunit